MVNSNSKELAVSVFEKDKKVNSFKIKCKSDVEDKKIFNLFSEIKKLVTGDTTLDINYIGVSSVNSEKPPNQVDPVDPIKPPVGNDIEITVPKLQSEVPLPNFKDEDFYGDDFSGAVAKRKYRLIYKDPSGVEKFVPLDGFEADDNSIPHHSFKFDSELKKLNFPLYKPDEFKYILRKMF